MTTEPDAFDRHDHARCIRSALDAAEEAFAARGLKLTPVRRRVLEILLEGHAACGAYEVLDRLAAEGLGSKPPVAYRALAFLVDNGFAHRIERLNAFVACGHPGERHDPAFMICRSCKTVAEAPMRSAALGQTAKASGFAIEQTVIEAEGLCAGCRESAA